MDTPDHIVRSRRLVCPDQVRPGALHIAQGKIARVAPYEDILRGCPVTDVGNLAVLPGLVDLMTRAQAPGRDHWEGFEALTRAAAAGGVTTLIDMPWHSTSPTLSAEALGDKLRAASQDALHVDVGFWAGLVPGNIHELKPMRQAGALGVACAMTPQEGHALEDASSSVGEHTLREAYPQLKRLGMPLMVRAQASHLLRRAQRAWLQGDVRSHATWLLAQPIDAELEALGLIMDLCAEHQHPTHVGPISCAEATSMLRQAKRRALPLSASTSPHHLFFHAGQISDGQTLFKASPPIREAHHQDALWLALREGLIELVCSDHDPCSPALKALELGDFESARHGVTSGQWLLPAVWTRAKLQGMTLTELTDLLCLRPAQRLALHEKGRLAPGCDADLVILNPEASFIARAQDLRHRHRASPYDGWILQGVVESTYLRGRCVYRRQDPSPRPPQGRLLLAR